MTRRTQLGAIFVAAATVAASRGSKSHRSRGSAGSVVALSLAVTAALALMVATFVLPGGGIGQAAAVGFDSASQTTANSATAGSTCSWSHAVGVGSERLLVVGVSVVSHVDGSTSRTVASVTANGTPFTSTTGTAIKSTNGVDSYVELWWLVAPPSGVNNIVVTFAGGADGDIAVCGATSWTGVDQVNPIRASATGNFLAGGSSTVASTSIGGVLSGDTVVDVIGTNGELPHWRGVLLGRC